MNGWWYGGYTTLYVNVSINHSGNNVYMWAGKVYLSPANGVKTSGGIIGALIDWTEPSSGNTGYINWSEIWDDSGNNYLQFYNNGFYTTGDVMTYRIYG